MFIYLVPDFSDSSQFKPLHGQTANQSFSPWMNIIFKYYFCSREFLLRTIINTIWEIPQNIGFGWKHIIIKDILDDWAIFHKLRRIVIHVCIGLTLEVIVTFFCDISYKNARTHVYFFKSWVLNGNFSLI